MVLLIHVFLVSSLCAFKSLCSPFFTFYQHFPPLLALHHISFLHRPNFPLLVLHHISVATTNVSLGNFLFEVVLAMDNGSSHPFLLFSLPCTSKFPCSCILFHYLNFPLLLASHHISYLHNLNFSPFWPDYIFTAAATVSFLLHVNSLWP